MAAASSALWEPSEPVLLLYETDRSPGTRDQAGRLTLRELTPTETLAAVTAALTGSRGDRVQLRRAHRVGTAITAGSARCRKMR